LTQKESENTVYKNKYVVFQKINELKIYNDDINPIVYFYDKIFDRVPNLDDLEEMIFLAINYSKTIFPKEKDNKPIYKCKLDSRRTRSFKKENLIFIGNKDIVVPKDEHYMSDKNDPNYGFMGLIVWKFFDFNILLDYELYSSALKKNKE